MTTHPDVDASLLLPPDELAAFVQPYLDRRQAYLDLAATHGSPLYVLEPDVLVRQAQAFQGAFSAKLPDPGFFFRR